MADGIRTDYVQDVAASLPQLLTAEQGGTINRYLRGLGLIGEQRGGTGPAAATPVWQYHLPDVLGSVRQVADPLGQVTMAQRDDPFGGLVSQAGLGASNYGFAGEEQDSETGQLYLRVRTYNPATGRFLQQDNVLGDSAQPRTLHRYAYAFNNPVNHTDPSGHMPPASYERTRRQASYNHSRQRIGLPQAGYAPSPFTQSGYAMTSKGPAYGPNLSNLGYSPRSANSGEHRTYSPASAKNKSQGHRPKACGFTDFFSGFGRAFQSGKLLPELMNIAFNSPPVLRKAWQDFQTSV